MTMAWAFRRCVVERYADFSGRSGRAEFWWFQLAATIITTPFSLLAPLGTDFTVLSWIVGLPLTLPWVAALVRRLHDTGSSAWTLLALVISIVGALYVVILLASRSERSVNRFGPVPEGPVRVTVG